MKKTMNIIGIVFALFLLGVIGVLAYQVLGMNIIPDKYMIWIVVVGLFSLLWIFLLVFPKIPWGVKIVLCFVSIPILIGGIFGITKINETVDFFKDLEASDYEVENYYVVVLRDSVYQKIEDLKGKTIGLFPHASETYERALTLLEEKVKTEHHEYDDLLKMATDLLGSKVESLLISDAHKTALEEQLESFASSIRVLDTIEVKTELDNIVKDTNVTEKPFNIYISGIDTYGSITTRSRSDVNIIMTVHPVTHEILLTSIPRDYYVQLHGTTGLKDKLTHAGVHGINMSIQTIEDLMDVDINYYIRVNFNTLISVVDVIGGIEIDSDTAFIPWTDRSCPIKKGKQFLDGKCALAFARERHAYLSGDRHRGENQQQVITKIIEKLSSSKTIINNYSQILNTLEGSFQTNMDTNKIYSLIKMQLEDMPKWSVNSIGLDGEGSMTYTYSYPKQKLWVMISDQSTVTSARASIDAIIAGKKYSEIK